MYRFLQLLDERSRPTNSTLFKLFKWILKWSIDILKR